MRLAPLFQCTAARELKELVANVLEVEHATSDRRAMSFYGIISVELRRRDYCSLADTVAGLSISGTQRRGATSATLPYFTAISSAKMLIAIS